MTILSLLPELSSAASESKRHTTRWAASDARLNSQLSKETLHVRRVRDRHERGHRRHRLSAHLRTTVTSTLGLVTLLIAAQSAMAVSDADLTEAVGVIQGALTLLGALLGSFLPDAHLAALTARGGLILLGVALRLLDVKPRPVADLLPALIAAPLLCQLAIAVH